MESDAQRALDQLRSVVRRTLRNERGQGAIRQPNVLDVNRLALDADRKTIRRRSDSECDYLGGIHDGIVDARRDSLCVTFAWSLEVEVIYLAHGASGSAPSMKPYIDGLERRGLGAHAIDLPVRKAEEVTAIYRRQVDQYPNAVTGGHSYGGRVASLLAATEPPQALVLFSYPLHRPGRPTDLRTSHWPLITCPVLLLSGESDQFARIELLRESVALLPDARLITWPGVGHGLTRVLDEALDRVAE